MNQSSIPQASFGLEPENSVGRREKRIMKQNEDLEMEKTKCAYAHVASTPVGERPNNHLNYQINNFRQGNAMKKTKHNTVKIIRAMFGRVVVEESEVISYYHATVFFTKIV